MTMEEYAWEVQRYVQTHLGMSVKVEVQKVLKNNGVYLWGIHVLRTGENVAPTIYLEDFYTRECRGEKHCLVMGDLMDLMEKYRVNQMESMAFFLDFDQVKDRICYRLVSAEMNRERMQGTPGRMWKDLCIQYYYYFTNELLGNGSILILNEHMKKWGVEEEDLYQLAVKNTPRLCPPRLIDLEQYMKDTQDANTEAATIETATIEIAAMEGASVPMIILSNTAMYYGAAALLYDNVLFNIANQLNMDLCIIPSSVHETLLVPASDIEELNIIGGMIREVNETAVSKEDILSNHPYYYDRKTREVICCE